MSDPAADFDLVAASVTIPRELTALARERAKAETSATIESAERLENAERSYRDSLKNLEAKHQAELVEIDRRAEETKAKVLERFETERSSATKEHDATRTAAIAKATAELEAISSAFEEGRWQASTAFETERERLKKHFDAVERQIIADLRTLEPLQAAAAESLQSVARFAPDSEDVEVEDPEVYEDAEGPLPALRASISALDAMLVKLLKLGLPKLLRNWQDLIIDAIFWLTIMVGLWPLKVEWTIRWIAATVATLAFAVVLRIVLTGRAKRQVEPICKALAQALAESERVVEAARDWSSARYQERRAALQARIDETTAKHEREFNRRVSAVERRRDEEVAKIDARHAALVAKLEQVRIDDLRRADELRDQNLADSHARFAEETKALRDAYQEQSARNKAKFEKEWNALADRWREGIARLRATQERIEAESRPLFEDWKAPLDPGWKPPVAGPPALRFGEFRVDLAAIPQAVPKDERLRAETPSRFVLPALAPFPGQGSLLLKAWGDGRDEAVKTLQSLMLRLLVTIPPGKVRFTIVDPVGLGQNFAAFMHLTDYDEALVSNRIWTETPHIEQRLADLTEHMERVIQKYLRNEFETIEEYNLQAGEVAEPFRVLIVANYPTNFSESAARRLQSILTSGARCGVYALLTVDTQQPSPTGCDLRDLEARAVNLVWSEGRFVWNEPEVGRFPLTLDPPPDPDTFIQVVRRVGELAKDANRVEVPFEVIAPAGDAWWTSNAASGIDVPLGRVGATRLQNLTLGRGTSQHVLIAGRTGSGKSTLLHALIVNLALHYSPEEVELYLIDFKKGVEFQAYAVHQLPHARVIAVESEREFGVSVLQRLDAELRTRGERFRDAGAQDLAGYRAAVGKPLPRILLIVDEFQEFFVEDDKVAQEAALLLDRLVRQGRAFGIHVHLGSQTLSGAYSLARSTIGQMAVRIALQCGETDAHLILSEDNSAARLLSRPGEAIYNDANGMMEGNHFFQVVWLPDKRKEDYLRRLDALDRERNPGVVRPRLVFEGNKPADVMRNQPLLNRLGDPDRPPAPRSATAWLGEAIAIKDPTAAVFRPQGGSNLLLIGQQDEAALGIMTTALVGLAAQHAPISGDDVSTPGVKFLALDGSPFDSSFAGLFAKVADALPHSTRVGGVRDVGEFLAEIGAEVERRTESPDSEAGPIYLFIYDLQRFRSLRKEEDDFGFGGGFGTEEKAVSASKRLATILREGPAVGVHTIVWCDSLNNVHRALDRQSLREFELRVLFQMSANDSSTLIDSPAAGRLGQNRAYFHSEEEGRLEKFRPYRVPDDAWLEQIRQALRTRPTAARPHEKVQDSRT